MPATTTPIHMTNSSPYSTPDRNFGQDVAFLRAHRPTIVLARGDSQIAVVPAFQGRVMTSTPAGDSGASLGFIKHDLIASPTIQPHINPYGGEDRFWIGPEGGQFAIFFAPGSPDFSFQHWQTPRAIDTDAFTVTDQSPTSVTLTHETNLLNWTGTKFQVKIGRKVSLLDAHAVSKDLGVEFGSARCVAYESENTLTNIGRDAWTKATGLLSIWILGMFKHSPQTTVVVPFKAGDGPAVIDDYFGKVPAGRLKTIGNCAFFKGDGQFRSKIGIPPARALPMCGSFAPSDLDPAANLLTIVTYTLPAGARDYVNSKWTMQKDPYAGDVVNSYNDGAAEPGGKPFGPFYELESSSPAAALAPQESITHLHRTIHLMGTRADLDRVARKALGVGLETIERAL